MSDRIAVMHAGRVEQLGTPEELYERPATRFVADFIGTTNLAARTRRGTGRHRLPCCSSRPGNAARSLATASSPGRDVELSDPAGSHPPVLGGRGGRGGPWQRTVEQVGLPRDERVVSGPHARAGWPSPPSSPKAAGRLPVGSEVIATWPPAEALVLAGGMASEEEVDHEERARRVVSIDLETALVRYMVERRVTPARAARADRAVRRRRRARRRSSPPAPAGGAAASASPAPASPSAAPASVAAPSRQPRAPRRSRPPRRSCSSTTGPSTSARTSSRRSRRSTASRSPTTSSPTPTRRTRSSATTAAATTSPSRSRSTSRPSARATPWSSSTSR